MTKPKAKQDLKKISSRTFINKKGADPESVQENLKAKEEDRKKLPAGFGITETVMSEAEYWQKKAAVLQSELMAAEIRKHKKNIVSFVSGHYKEVVGEWGGDRVWCHFKKESGGEVHVNKEKIEYIETF